MSHRVLAPIRRRPVTSFLVLTFVISYVLGIPFHVMPDPATLSGTYRPRTVTVVGPALAALIVAAAGGGLIPIAGLIRSLLLPRHHLPLIAWIVVMGPATGMLAFYAVGIPADFLLRILKVATPLFVLHMIVQVTLVGIGEELGWRGWLLPHLSAHRSFLAATALTGLAWGLWHLPGFLFSPATAIPFAVLVASLSVLFSRLWHGTGGATGIVALAHGFINAPFLFFETVVRTLPNGDYLANRAFMFFAGFYFLVAVEIVVHQRHVWRQRPQRSAAASGHSG